MENFSFDNFDFFEELKTSLEDALAYERGDTSRCRAVKLKKSKFSQVKGASFRRLKARPFLQKKTLRDYYRTDRPTGEEPETVKTKIQKEVKSN